MKKTIIAITGPKDVRLNALCENLEKNKFKKVSISNKVKEFAKYLVKGEISQDILRQIRDRGYQVSKLYWTNLLLSSMKDDDLKIIIEDLEEMDIVDGVMMVYYSSNSKFIQGCTNIYSWDEERLSKEISRLIRVSKK